MVGSTSLYQLPNAWIGMSLLVGMVGIEGIAIAGIDQAFKLVELSSLLPLALPGEAKKLEKLAVFGIFLRESPDITLNLRVKLDAADANTIASCADI